jgi:hypothetical protein
MTDDRIAHIELLQKSGDADFLRAVPEIRDQVRGDHGRALYPRASSSTLGGR